MTLKEAKARVTFLNHQMAAGVSRTMRPAIVAELKRLSMGLYKGDFKDGPDPQNPEIAKRLAKFAKPVYTGPRCEFCGGEAESGVCANESVEWPHPPSRTGICA